MLLRVFQADIRNGHEAAFFAELGDLAGVAGPVKGLHAVQIGRQMTDAGERVIIVSTWHDFASLQRAVGRDWQRAFFLPSRLGDLVENVHVNHYEVVAGFPVESARSGGAPRLSRDDPR